MIPKLLCSSCGHELSSQDKFCSNCGEKVSFEGVDERRSAEVEAVEASTVNCRLCGSENPADAKYCGVCGAVVNPKAKDVAVEKRRENVQGPVQRKTGKYREARQGSSHSGPGRGLAGWKVIAIVGGGFVVALIVIGVTRNRPVTVPNTPQTQSVISPTMMEDIEQLRRLVEANPKDAASLLRLANLLHDAKFIDQAILHYKKYLALNEKDPDARVDLGICYYESGDKASAIQEMQKALSYSPRHQLAHFNLGIVTLGSGDVETAMEWFRKCIAISPETETAKRAQRLIDQHAATGTLKLN
jgi:cytochrome c-type biogenesis protein CcmH/NrfG